MLYNAPCSISASRENIIALIDSDLDGVVTKTCTLEPRNSGINIYRHNGVGAVNKSALSNLGFDYYNDHKIYECARLKGKTYTISVAGTQRELRKILKKDIFADYIEYNISCPNAEVYSCFGLEHKKPFGVKLPPYTMDKSIDKMVTLLKKEKETSPLQYVVCCNTYLGIMNGTIGGISGAALKPLALINVKKFSEKLAGTGIKVVGCGGISTAKDVEEYLNCGASAVQIGTAAIEHGRTIFTKIKTKATL